MDPDRDINLFKINILNKLFRFGSHLANCLQ